MNDVLRNYLDTTCICYLDNILVYLVDPRTHQKDVRDILQTLQDAKLLLKPEKYRFYAKEVTFLGYVILVDGIKMDPAKVLTVLN
jgi:hypothetical protein